MQTKDQQDDISNAGLTDEEQAAMKELEAQSEDYDPDADSYDADEAHERLKEQSGHAGEDVVAHRQPKEDADDDAETAGDEVAAQTGADGKPGDDAASTDEGADDADKDQPASVKSAPLLVVDAPEGAEDRLKEIASEKADLRKKYDEGDLTFEEYESKRDALDEERTDIKLQMKEHETATKLEQQRQANERDAEINGFLSEVGIKRDPSDLRFATLDMAVRIVASDEANSSLSVREILQKAHDLCIEQGTLQKKAAPEDKQEQKQAEPPKRRALDAPPTLAKLPASEVTDTDDGSRFKFLSSIKDPDAREAAFAKLSAADQQAALEAGF